MSRRGPRLRQLAEPLVVVPAGGARVRANGSAESRASRQRSDAAPIASVEQLQRRPVVAADLTVGHLAVAVLDRCGNPSGVPTTIPLALDGLTAAHRDGLVRAAISQVHAIAAVMPAPRAEDLLETQVRSGSPTGQVSLRLGA